MLATLPLFVIVTLYPRLSVLSTVLLLLDTLLKLPEVPPILPFGHFDRFPTA